MQMMQTFVGRTLNRATKAPGVSEDPVAERDTTRCVQAKRVKPNYPRSVEARSSRKTVGELTVHKTKHCIGSITCGVNFLEVIFYIIHHGTSHLDKIRQDKIR